MIQKPKDQHSTIYQRELYDYTLKSTLTAIIEQITHRQNPTLHQIKLSWAISWPWTEIWGPSRLPSPTSWVEGRG